MSFNSSSASNASLLPSTNSSTSCLNYRTGFFMFTAFSVASVLLLLPFCIVIVYLGLRRWKTQRSASSQSDIIAYHLVAMELIGITGCGLYVCGACVSEPWSMTVGVWLYSATSYGQIFFHILTCVERHLAVVHPITYLRLRNRGGVRIRNATIGCVWLLFLGSFYLTSLPYARNIISGIFLSVVSIAIISFCSLSVLCVLIRPGPGEGAKDKETLSRQSKMRAFNTIMAIMAALLVRFVGCLLVLVVYSSSTVSERVRCGVLVSGVWFCLPSSLVIPLLFLHRAGKLMCCKNSPNQDKDESRAS